MGELFQMFKNSDMKMSRCFGRIILFSQAHRNDFENVRVCVEALADY